MKWFCDNGLSIALFAVVGHGRAGWIANNEGLPRDGVAPLSLLNYLTGADFNSTLFENWESESLQIATYGALRDDNARMVGALKRDKWR